MRLAIVLMTIWAVFYVSCVLVVASATGDLAWTFWSRVADVFGG